MDLANEIVKTCYQTYAIQPTFLAPEITYFNIQVIIIVVNLIKMIIKRYRCIIIIECRWRKINGYVCEDK